MGVRQSKVTDRTLFDSYVSSDKLGDLSGKVVAITGTSPSSIGYHLAEAAVRKGADRVILLNRRSTRSARAEEGEREA